MSATKTTLSLDVARRAAEWVRDVDEAYPGLLAAYREEQRE